MQSTFLVVHLVCFRYLQSCWMYVYVTIDQLLQIGLFLLHTNCFNSLFLLLIQWSNIWLSVNFNALSWWSPKALLTNSRICVLISAAYNFALDCAILSEIKQDLENTIIQVDMNSYGFDVWIWHILQYMHYNIFTCISKI